jgi:hemin uptake protein HemP
MEQEPPRRGPDEGTNRRVLSSEMLFDGGRVVIIRHAGEEYRLQLTSSGKLILTK